MAIAVNGGHVSRALDFYHTEGKYFVLGGTTPWTDETIPDAPTVGDYKLKDIVGLKKVDSVFMVIPTDDTDDVISYRNQNWKRVPAEIKTTTTSGITLNSKTFSVSDVSGFSKGSKIRIANIYESIIENIVGTQITVATPAPADISAGSEILGGALVEGAKYVYVECYLNYNQFPLVTYRQIGLFTGVTQNASVLVTDAYRENLDGSDIEIYNNSGILEILDNRVPNTRDINQRELLSLIIEF